MSKILLVEDDFTLGAILKDHLEMRGYEALHLSVPSQTIDKLVENEYDLVVLDKLLKGVDGTELCKEIRKTIPILEIPILMMSGWDGAENECLDAGANNFIAKPFEVEGFLKSIEATLEPKKV